MMLPTKTIDVVMRLEPLVGDGSEEGVGSEVVVVSVVELAKLPEIESIILVILLNMTSWLTLL